MDAHRARETTKIRTRSRATISTPHILAALATCKQEKLPSASNNVYFPPINMKSNIMKPGYRSLEAESVRNRFVGEKRETPRRFRIQCSLHDVL